MENRKSRVELGIGVSAGVMSIATGWWVNSMASHLLAFAILMTVIGSGLIVTGIIKYYQPKGSNDEVVD